ncbi:hypothetical protein TD95_004000 [Thielaviopsis punctulata]|uniref:Arf-GAP domain-containing protein n=1 Tax=Thielaviopsis punctulata TaxID=72032 RepID=A0A0F4ZBT0_9PEZI|nr:hypothetical protein TD95_004000 [Thielaviopsis punctulata]
MSRRAPNPAAERIAQNQQTIKSLLKLECNKVCSDCKRNKHPRWASWNIGIFICIRCSGIHRSMGTHISRVKSVDLDSWTDEQVASVLAWGNSRANKYWEAKLAPGHVPSESKIENFIRTKYELKRWTMDGPRPDPSTLDVDGDEDIPLSLVKEKHNIERKESIRKASIGQVSTPPARKVAPPPQVDLIGGNDAPSPASATKPVAKTPVATAAAKAASGRDSLLGLDFFGEATATPPRPASTSTTGSGGTQSRPDLKQSILSLYASAPRPQPAVQPAPVASAGGFGAMGSPSSHQSRGSLGGLNDAFGNMGFGAPAAVAAPAPAKPVDPFAGLGFGGNKSPVSATQSSSSNAFSGLSGGSFFDTKPAAPAAASAQSAFGGFGDFTSQTPAAAKPATTNSSAMGDLFGLSTSSPAPAPAAVPASATMASSPFNLSASTSSAKPVAAATAGLGASSSAWSGSDVWGSSAWGSEAKAEPAKPVLSGVNDFGWGSMAPSAGAGASSSAATMMGGSFAATSIVPGASGGFTQAPKAVAADEEFGGWTSSTPAASNGGSKGFGGDNDLFSNVWQ